MAGSRSTVLTQLAESLPDPKVRIGDLLRTCLLLGKETDSSTLRDWATKELKGYQPIADVPEYRYVQGQLLRAIDVPYRGTVQQIVNLWQLPREVSEKLEEGCPLNQPVEELESSAIQCEARNEPLQLSVIGEDLFLKIWSNDEVIRELGGEIGHSLGH